MRLLTGPVCIVDQTAPKTTPRPTPREASLIKEVRTQLAPAGAARVRGAARAARRWRVLLQRLGVVFERVRVCGDRRRGAARSSKLGMVAQRAAAPANPVSTASADEKVKSGSF